MKERVTAADVRAVLRERYALPEWALMFEVADATGANQRRWADAVAINCYPSRGLEIHGIEIKVYRNDWLNELKKPEKSAAVQQYCDRWWIAAPAGIVQPMELPSTWGLLELTSGKLRQAVPAPLLQAAPITRDFMASVMRNAGKIDDKDIAKRIEKTIAEERAKIAEYIDSQVNARTRRHKELLDKVEKIKTDTGIDLTSYTPATEIVAAIRFAMSSDITGRYNALSRLRSTLTKATKAIEEGFAAAGLEHDTE